MNVVVQRARAYVRAVIVVVLLALVARSVHAQPDFPMFLPYNVPDLQDGSVDFGDLEGDGDLDLAVAGQNEGERVIRVYRLMDIAHFRGDERLNPAKDFRQIAFGGRPVIHGTVRWGDYDGDGDDDLVVTGQTRFFEGGVEMQAPVTDVYPNIGQHGQNAWFDDAIRLQGLYRSSAAWGDYDGDGDLDILASGLPALNASEPVTRIHRNDGNSFTLVETPIPGVVSGDVAWADYDGDGLDDVAIMGDAGRGTFITQLFRNTGGGFAESGVDMPGLAYGSLDWQDFDGDGDPDLLVTGGRLDPRFLTGITKMYRNDDGRLVEMPVELEGWTLGEARWGDADLDGDLDLFALGSPTPLGRAALRVLAFDGSGFSPIWELSGARFGSLAVGDYNGDGDADLAFIGEFSETPRFRFYSNRAHPECLLAEWVPEGGSQGDCDVNSEE